MNKINKAMRTHADFNDKILNVMCIPIKPVYEYLVDSLYKVIYRK